jgi:hypothetical protein
MGDENERLGAREGGRQQGPREQAGRQRLAGPHHRTTRPGTRRAFAIPGARREELLPTRRALWGEISGMPVPHISGMPVTMPVTMPQPIMS